MGEFQRLPPPVIVDGGKNDGAVASSVVDGVVVVVGEAEVVEAVEGRVVEERDALVTTGRGLPQGLGMAAPVAPAVADSLPIEGNPGVLPAVLPFPEEFPSIMACIMGSWTLWYKFDKAENPPGRFSNCDIAKSCWRIIYCMCCGLRISSID